MTHEHLIKHLRQLRSRAERERTGTFYIEGARIVAQALESGAEIGMGIVAPSLLNGSHALNTVAALKRSGAPVLHFSAKAFKRISFKENLQGIGAVIRSRIENLPPPEMTEGTWVALDNVGNPGNLGAVIRSADAVGAAGIILLGSTADPYHPEAIRASMGSLFALKIMRSDFEPFIRWKNEAGLVMVGTSPDADQDYDRVTYPEPVLLLMGSERSGLSPEQQAVCDTLIRIPMVGTCDSLNLGVAASVVLYELFRQRKTFG